MWNLDATSLFQDERLLSKKNLSGKVKAMKKNDIDCMGSLNKKVKILGDGLKVIYRDKIYTAVYSSLKHANHSTVKPLEHPMTSHFLFNFICCLTCMHIQVTFHTMHFGADQSLLFIPLTCGIAYLSMLTSKYRLSRKRNLQEKVSSVEPVAKYVALRWMCFLLSL